MNVRSFKLVSGQELIAELIAPTGTGYQIKNPLVLHAMKGHDGQDMLGFAKWSMVHVDGQVISLLDQALAAEPAEVIAEIAKSYVQQTSALVLSPTAASQILLG